MKRASIILIISAITLLVSSCHSGCGCPGGAGYKTSQNISTERTSQQV